MLRCTGNCIEEGTSDWYDRSGNRVRSYVIPDQLRRRTASKKSRSEATFHRARMANMPALQNKDTFSNKYQQRARTGTYLHRCRAEFSASCIVT